MQNLTILNSAIRHDSEGRYCLNDLHRASGGEDRHSPRRWLSNQQTSDLAKEIEKDGNPSILSIQGLGTFVCKELVYSYAMWISATFHLKVIRAYDEMMAQKQQQMLVLPDNRQLALMVIAEADRADKAEAELDAAQPAVQFMDEVATHECERHIGTVHKELFNRAIKLDEFKKWLRDNRWLMRTSNEATAWAVDRGYMRQRPEFKNGKQFSVPVITSKGYVTLRHLFREGELFIRIPGKGIAVQRPGAMQ